MERLERRDNRLRSSVSLAMPQGSFPGPGCWLAPVALIPRQHEVAVFVVEGRPEARAKWGEPYGVRSLSLVDLKDRVVALYFGLYSVDHVLLEREFTASGRHDLLAKMFTVAERQTHLHVIGLDESLTSFELIEVENTHFRGIGAPVARLPETTDNLAAVLRFRQRVSFENVCAQLRSDYASSALE